MTHGLDAVERQNLSVSVVIPAYNRLPILGRALESVANQTYPIKQVILVDDGSTDGTAEWVSDNYSNINVVSLIANSGAAAARNAGIQRANADLVAFLDSDDSWLPTYISRQVAAIAADSSASFGYCSRYLNQGKFNSKGVKCSPSDDHDLLKSMLFNCFIHTMSQVVVRRSAFERIGSFNEQLPMCEDWELYMRLLTLGKPTVVDEELVIKDWRPDSWAFRGNGDAWLQGFNRGLDAFYSNPASAPYADLRPLVEASVRKQVARSLLLFKTFVLGQAPSIQK
jgi:glycosyltransferase involved in cell wall biosynthesis